MSTLIKEYNLSIGRQHSLSETYSKTHERTFRYHIGVNGNAIKLDYKAIGIGDDIVDIFCKKLILIKEFVKNAYTAIRYMERFCLGM